MQVIVPDLGDIDAVEVTEICVSAGDKVEADTPILVIESDKASMELPADAAGTIEQILVAVGDVLQQGAVVAHLFPDAADAAGPSSEQAPAEHRVIADQANTAIENSAPSPPTLSGSVELAPPAQRPVEYDLNPRQPPHAGPAARKLARELGVDLAAINPAQVTQSATGGKARRITKADVKHWAQQQLKSSGSQSAGSATGIPAVPEVDFARFGAVETVIPSRIQQQVAANMRRNWLNIPHVTQHDEADITDLEAFRHSLADEAQRRGVKLTPLAFITKICCHLLARHPTFNSSLHSSGESLVLKRYINIGIAVETADGLVVPVIRNADKLGVWELSSAITTLAQKARSKKLAMDDLSGGTFTISSLGAVGGSGFTPIVNAPEVAILGVAKAHAAPVWDGRAFQRRQMLPLSLSYDHRVINGVDGGRFMLALTEILSDMRRLAL